VCGGACEGDAGAANHDESIPVAIRGQHSSRTQRTLKEINAKIGISKHFFWAMSLIQKKDSILEEINN